MTARTYTFVIEGLSDSDKQVWQTKGKVHCEFRESLDVAMKQSFYQLTTGKAVYGNPGAGGCRGPYTVTMLSIVLEA